MRASRSPRAQTQSMCPLPASPRSPILTGDTLARGGRTTRGRCRGKGALRCQPRKHSEIWRVRFRRAACACRHAGNSSAASALSRAKEHVHGHGPAKLAPPSGNRCPQLAQTSARVQCNAPRSTRQRRGRGRQLPQLAAEVHPHERTSSGQAEQPPHRARETGRRGCAPRAPQWQAPETRGRQTQDIKREPSPSLSRAL